MRLKRAALVLLGLYVCLVASIIHRHTYVVGEVEIPWAMALDFIAVYSVTRAVRPWVRLGDAFFALGWALGLMIPMIPTISLFSMGGSYLIAQDWLGLTFMFGSIAVLALAVIRRSPGD